MVYYQIKDINQLRSIDNSLILCSRRRTIMQSADSNSKRFPRYRWIDSSPLLCALLCACKKEEMKNADLVTVHLPTCDTATLTSHPSTSASTYPLRHAPAVEVVATKHHLLTEFISQSEAIISSCSNVIDTAIKCIFFPSCCCFPSCSYR